VEGKTEEFAKKEVLLAVVTSSASLYTASCMVPQQPVPHSSIS
jgi:hypothetical protein